MDDPGAIREILGDKVVLDSTAKKVPEGRFSAENSFRDPLAGGFSSIGFCTSREESRALQVSELFTA